MSFDINALSTSVLEIVTDFSNEYQATEDVDHATRCSNLKAGSVVPAKGGIKLTQNKEHIDNYAFEASEQIRAICNEQREGILASMSDAPTDEALRMMQSISLREQGVSKTELEALASKYGSCYQVRRFIADQMRKRELGYPADDELDVALRQIDHAEEVGIESVRPSNMTRTNMNKAARLALIKQNLYGEGVFAL